MARFLVIGMMTFILIACQQDQENTHSFNGYIDADLIYLSPDFSGRLVKLPIQRGQRIQPNQFLFGVEQTRELYNIQMSKLDAHELEAQRQQIATNNLYDQINYNRTVGMRRQNVASQNDLDLAKRNLDSTKQQLVENDFRIQRNQKDIAVRKWEAERKLGYSQDSGIVFDTYYTLGEFVQAGSPVLSLITQNNIKAIFFAPETRLGQLALNQKVRLHIDNNSKVIEGHVSYISNVAQFTSPLIYSHKDRAQLVFRVEAKIEAPELEKIHLGQPVTVELV